MTDNWNDRLSEYLDGELTPDERSALETHLTTCRDCVETLDELRAVIARAGALRPRAPETDLWPGVAERIDRPPTVVPFLTRSRRRFSFTVPQLVAAGIALMVVSGGGVWVLNHGGRATDAPPVAAATDPSLVPASFADPHYDEAIADLQQTLQDGRAQLDPQTIRILEASLGAIDKAINDSRQALAADPANLYLHNHLADARQRKIALLRRAVALVNKG
jgi:tetratricopeptide (TPR) repeat protein